MLAKPSLRDKHSVAKNQIKDDYEICLILTWYIGVKIIIDQAMIEFGKEKSGRTEGI